MPPSDSPPAGAPIETRPAATIDATALPTEGRAKSRRVLRHATWAVALLLTGILGSWTHHAIERSLRQLRADALTSTLDAEVQAMDVWIAEKQLGTRRLARDRRVRDGVDALLRSRRACASLEAAALSEPLAPFLQDETVAAFHVLDRDLRLLAALPGSACGIGELSPPLRTAAAAAFAGDTPFVAPQLSQPGFVIPGTAHDPAVVWFLTPVIGAQGRADAILALGKYADTRFARLFATANTGRTGEAYAFDAQGMLLSESRFNAELVARGLVPRSEHPTSVLNVAVRVPGAGEGKTAPLTRMAEEALSGPPDAARHGVLLAPYANYRGAQVVGAWQWLPRYGMGVAVEMDADEAYAPLAFLNVAFGVVLAAVVTALSVTLLYVAWLRRQMNRAHRLGAYVLERKIGEGGMANVYLARHALLRRPTAVKILRPERSSPQFVSRFEREVRLASQLSHPNTVEIYDYGRTPDGQFYYAMEYLDGVELFELIRDGPVPVGRTIYLLRQVCAGLAEAHGKGLVHRDIKPENIMVCVHGGEYDVAKILDFGLVKNVADPHTRDLTRTVKFIGTPQYMSPERFRSPGDVDARADIYAVGAVAFYMLTGRELFQAASDLDLANRVLNEEAPRPSTISTQAIPVELDLLVTACLEKRREDRPQRAADLVEAFDALAVAHRWSQREAFEWWQKRRRAAVP